MHRSTYLSPWMTLDTSLTSRAVVVSMVPRRDAVLVFCIDYKNDLLLSQLVDMVDLIFMYVKFPINRYEYL